MKLMLYESALHLRRLSLKCYIDHPVYMSLIDKNVIVIYIFFAEQIVATSKDKNLVIRELKPDGSQGLTSISTVPPSMADGGSQTPTMLRQVTHSTFLAAFAGRFA